MHGLAAIGDAFRLLLVVCAISVPLGLWKLGEIAWWLASHVTVSWS